MLQFRRLFFIAVLMQGVMFSQAQVSSSDSMVHKIFASLQAKDEKAFVALYPNSDQFGRFMRSIMEAAFNSEEMKMKMAADESARNLNIDSLVDAQVSMFSNPAMFAQMAKKFGTTFQKIIEKGEAKGVEWSKAKMINYTVDTSAAKDDGDEAMAAAGIKQMDGIIDFMVGDSAYQLWFDKSMYIEKEGGWFGAEFKQLLRKGEKPGNESADELREVEAPKEELPPPPPPDKPKTKTKSKTTEGGTKTKTKTKTKA